MKRRIDTLSQNSRGNHVPFCVASRSRTILHVGFDAEDLLERRVSSPFLTSDISNRSTTQAVFCPFYLIDLTFSLTWQDGNHQFDFMLGLGYIPQQPRHVPRSIGRSSPIGDRLATTICYHLNTPRARRPTDEHMPDQPGPNELRARSE